ANQQSGHSTTPITVTGCLQQDGRTYIVTRLNEPAQRSVGTSGNPGAVEREQLREAANAYRIETKDHIDMDSMVGKQVRVSGTLVEAANLPSPNTSTPSQPNDTRDKSDTPRPNGDGGEKIDRGDLAKIDAASISVLAENCGGTPTSTSGSGSKQPDTKKKE